jgi:predicted deacylase
VSVTRHAAAWLTLFSEFTNTLSVKTTKSTKSAPFGINGQVIIPGTRQRIEIPVARLPTETWLSLPLEVVHGKKIGPNLWLSAAVHGDELNGVEIIRQVLDRLDAAELRGTVIAAPIVNVFGFIQQSRYLPDRRDLNRAFPGSKNGSLAGRLAHLFMTEVVNRCDYGIDLHTGSNHRTNLPQIRANLRDEETNRCAEAFMPNVMMHSETRDGSLREAATELGKHVLLYEAGEPLRFDDFAIRRGIDGVLRVMAALKMRTSRPKRPKQEPWRVSKSSWVRARRSGMMRMIVKLGDHVAAKQELAIIADAFGSSSKSITSPFEGLVIGHTNNPFVQQGDAVVHVARLDGEPPAME